MIGNHIYIKLDETGTFLVLAHLRQDSARVKQGDHVEEGTILAEVGNSGNSSEPHLHIHHQRQDPSTTNMFMAEGLPLYFRDIDGPTMPEGGIHEQDGKSIPQGQAIAPVH
ncbi:Peptidase family M23 [compost metagenome]